uniref:hypothetical protein n=1 Tax=Hyphomonas sp. TaxID=87 RepID=UPI0030F78B36
MTLFTRLLMILAVAAFAATPIMACCMTGHAQTHAMTIQAEAPPCHDELAPDAAKPMPGDMVADCPGCADCESAMLAARTADQATLLSSAGQVQLSPVEVNRWTGYDIPRTLRTTGPPRASPRLPTTPVSLKQRLLV